MFRKLLARLRMNLVAFLLPENTFVMRWSTRERAFELLAEAYCQLSANDLNVIRLTQDQVIH